MDFKVIIRVRGVPNAPRMAGWLKEMGLTFWKGGSSDFHTDFMPFADAAALRDLAWEVDGVDIVSLFPDYGFSRDALGMTRALAESSGSPM